MAKKKRDIYQEVTDRIVELLESGELPPWQQPIQGMPGDPFPKNRKTSKSYRGINVWLLSLTAWAKGYDSQYWSTFKQAKELGGQIRKGEQGTLVTFWKSYAKVDQETKVETVLPVLRHYVVFNTDQIEGLEPPQVDAIEPIEFVPIERAEQIIAEYSHCPVIEHRGNRAYYEPLNDRIVIAPPERFRSPETFYATLNHEVTHATGHQSRLDRGIDTKLAPFGSPDYSKEELVAEMGSAFLCAVAGISPATIEQSATYIEGWRKALKGDKKLVIQAAGQAQKASDHVLGIKPEALALDVS